MRRFSSAHRALDLFNACAPRQKFVCQRCALFPPAASFSTGSHQLERQKRSNRERSTDFTEKIRRRLWGTDNPPGQKDPYSHSERELREELDGQELERLGKLDKRLDKQRQEDLSAINGVKDLEKSEELAEIEDDQWAEPSSQIRRGIAIISPEEIKEAEGRGEYIAADNWEGLLRLTDITPVSSTRKHKEYVQWLGCDGVITDDYSFKLSQRPVSDLVDLTANVHRAIVEVLTLQQSGRPLTDVCFGRDDKIIAATDAVQITLSSGKRAELKFPSEEVRDAILQASVIGESADTLGFNNEPTESDPPTLADVPQKRATDIAAWGNEWLEIPLTDLDIKFAVLKRTYQLTGNLIPDSKLPSVNNVQSLLDVLATPPKVKNVAEILLSNQDLMALPNVRISDRRITWVDKEQEVGRWKTIEKELVERELPLPGGNA